MGKRGMETLKKIYRYATDFLLITAFLMEYEYIWRTRLNILLQRDFQGKGNMMMLAVYIVITVLLFLAFGGFQIGNFNKENVILSQSLAVIVGNCIQVVLTVLMVGSIYHIKEIVVSLLGLTACNLLVVFILTSVLMKLYTVIFPPYRMIQVYGAYENNLREKMNARADKYQIMEQISCEENMPRILEEIEKYDAVLLNDIPNEKRNKILKHCFDKNIRVYFTPKISDIMVKGAEELNLFDTPLYLQRNLGLNIAEKAIKRFFDIICSAVLLLLTSPLMLITAIAIKVDDGGPVFFTQERCTLNRKIFKIYKFRSMIVDAEVDGKSKPAGDRDDRITKVGKVIRATRIDELPQLFNILKGEMSLIGPRPERIEHVDKYCEEVPEFAYRLKVKGGLTGYAQVYGKYNTTAYDKLKLDLIYIENYSLMLDLKILFMTFKVIFMKESTEGFSEEAIDKIKNAK